MPPSVLPPSTHTPARTRARTRSHHVTRRPGVGGILAVAGANASGASGGARTFTTGVQPYTAADAAAAAGAARGGGGGGGAPAAPPPARGPYSAGGGLGGLPPAGWAAEVERLIAAGCHQAAVLLPGPTGGTIKCFVRCGRPPCAWSGSGMARAACMMQRVQCFRGADLVLQRQGRPRPPSVAKRAASAPAAPRHSRTTSRSYRPTRAPPQTHTAPPGRTPCPGACAGCWARAARMSCAWRPTTGCCCRLGAAPRTSAAATWWPR